MVLGDQLNQSFVNGKIFEIGLIRVFEDWFATLETSARFARVEDLYLSLNTTLTEGVPTVDEDPRFSEIEGLFTNFAIHFMKYFQL